MSSPDSPVRVRARRSSSPLPLTILRPISSGQKSKPDEQLELTFEQQQESDSPPPSFRSTSSTFPEPPQSAPCQQDPDSPPSSFRSTSSSYPEPPQSAPCQQGSDSPPSSFRSTSSSYPEPAHLSLPALGRHALQHDGGGSPATASQPFQFIQFNNSPPAPSPFDADQARHRLRQRAGRPPDPDNENTHDSSCKSNSASPQTAHKVSSEGEQSWARAVCFCAILTALLGVVLAALSGPLGPNALPVPVASESLTELAREVTALLPGALTTSAARHHDRKVTAMLFNSQLERMGTYGTGDGTDTLTAAILQSKARSLLSKRALNDAGEVELRLLYILPWALGWIDQIPVLGGVLLLLPGLDEPVALLVAGAPTCALDLQIAEETLTICGFKKTWAGPWSLRAWYDLF